MAERAEDINECSYNRDEEMDITEITRNKNISSAHAIIAASIGVMYVLLYEVMRKQCVPTPERNWQRMIYLSRLYNGSDSDCVNMVRMKRYHFFKLCTLLRTRSLLVDTLNVRIEEQVAMLLHTLGHSVRNRVIRFNFQRSGETVSRYLNAALYAIGELRHEMIKPPMLYTLYKIQSNDRFMPFFKDCIGSIDGTHIKARVPKKIESAFRGRKPFPTQNVLAAVDFDLRFTYVLAGWEGSAHDAMVLRNALEHDDSLFISEGKYYLVDGGYSTKKGFISPYRATRYHMKEFSSIRPTNYKELFNLRHSSLRTTVERAFGSLKNRFGIIKCDPYFPFQTQVDMILVCCILHNWIITESGDDFILTEDEWGSRGHVTRRDEIVVDDSREWLEKRDQIANAMWNRMIEAGY